MAETDEQVIGYTCFVPVPCSEISWEIYWIVVSEGFRFRGIGKGLIERTEKIIKNLGGKRVYIETSSRDLYKPTRNFYKSCKYVFDVIQNDFYNTGDSRIFYIKVFK